MIATEKDHWKLIHAIRGGKCKVKCDDPACAVGCLQQSAKVFRGDIMHGIKIVREQGSTRYPLTASATISGSLECNGQCPCDNVNATHNTPYGGPICNDSVCHVTGCMKVPAWHFRDLIKEAIDGDLIKALKK